MRHPHFLKFKERGAQTSQHFQIVDPQIGNNTISRKGFHTFLIIKNGSVITKGSKRSFLVDVLEVPKMTQTVLQCPGA